MKRYFIFCTAALIILTMTILPGCADTKITVTRELPQEIDKLSLTEVWNAVAETTDLQEQGAEFGNMYLRVGSDGSIDSLYFTFQGWNRKGKPCVYFAEMGRKGKITIREYESQAVSVTRHPSTIFSEIDKLGLASLEPGNAGLSIQIGFQSGDVGYSYGYLDLYQLEGGELLPLKELVFHSRDPWCTISVFKLSSITDNRSTTVFVTTAPGPVPAGERTSQIWFLSDDINKAEVFEYLGSTK